MTNETLQLCAYHESGRVVFAYQYEYGCDSMAISETDAGMGQSKLNGYQDIEYIQAIFSGKPQSVTNEKVNKAIEVAKNLMKIYCAGSCAESYYANNKQTDTQMEMEIPGQDIKYIELAQSFLKHHVPNHPDDYPSKIIVQNFQELKKPDTWKAIETLAERILKTEDKSFTRYYIEDALMMAGFKINKQIVKQGISVKEDNETTIATEETKSVNYELNGDKMLNKVLTDFLKIVRTEWREDELEEAIKYLKDVFKKFK